jgi:transcription termination factor NusB
MPCLQIGSVSFDRQGVADHASQLANNIQGNLKRSLEGLGVVRAAVLGTGQHVSAT